MFISSVEPSLFKSRANADPPYFQRFSRSHGVEAGKRLPGSANRPMLIA
jgi:hypothetical protein